MQHKLETCCINLKQNVYFTLEIMLYILKEISRIPIIKYVCHILIIPGKLLFLTFFISIFPYNLILHFSINVDKHPYYYHGPTSTKM